VFIKSPPLFLVLSRMQQIHNFQPNFLRICVRFRNSLLACDAVECCGRIPTFQRSMQPSASLPPADGGSMDIQNVGILLHTTRYHNP
jgi:hypothetical protein